MCCFCRKLWRFLNFFISTSVHGMLFTLGEQSTTAAAGQNHLTRRFPDPAESQQV